MPSHDPTITSVCNNGVPIAPNPPDVYALDVGTIVVKGVAFGDGDLILPQPVPVVAIIFKPADPPNPFQQSPAQVSYGEPNAAQDRPYEARWPLSPYTGRCFLRVSQVTPFDGWAGATFNIH